ATTVLLLFLAQRLVLKRYPFLIAGSSAIVGVVGLLLVPGLWAIACCAMIGFCCAFTFTLAMAIPPSVAAPDDAHRLSAAVFTISYFSAFLVPMIGGASWDLTGIAATAFVPVALCAVLIILLGLSLNLDAARTTQPAWGAIRAHFRNPHDGATRHACLSHRLQRILADGSCNHTGIFLSSMP